MKFSEKVNEILNEATSRNVDVGIEKKDKNAKSNISKIEKWLDKNGIYYHNEGSDLDTFNINAGFNNDEIKLSEEFEKFLSKMSVYFTTETF